MSKRDNRDRANNSVWLIAPARSQGSYCRDRRSSQAETQLSNRQASASWTPKPVSPCPHLLMSLVPEPGDEWILDGHETAASPSDRAHLLPNYCMLQPPARVSPREPISHTAAGPPSIHAYSTQDTTRHLWAPDRIAVAPHPISRSYICQMQHMQTADTRLHPFSPCELTSGAAAKEERCPHQAMVGPLRYRVCLRMTYQERIPCVGIGPHLRSSSHGGAVPKAGHG